MAIIEVNHLTKEYRLGALQGLKQTLLNSAARLAGRKVPERRMFKALDDVSFSVKEGEVVGIIGHNGAGKSTLLKMLARISTPTTGSVKVNGRIAPLIEVGAGFVPDLTGRENVYLNGSILGLSKREVDRKFAEIVEFAEMGQFIDTPVKRYSSGMQVRLAFAVATCIDSEILIVDEVLAVGDLAFQRKCFDRMEDLIRRQGRTVLLVSHNIRQVERLCSRVLLLSRGRLISDGNSKHICTEFYEISDKQIAGLASTHLDRANENEWATGEIALRDIDVLAVSGARLKRLAHGQPVRVQLHYDVLRPLREPVFGIGVHTTDFVYLATRQSNEQIDVKALGEGSYVVTFDVPAFPFMPGVYSLRAGVAEGASCRTIFYAENLVHLQVVSDSAGDRTWNEGIVELAGAWSLRPAEKLLEVNS